MSDAGERPDWNSCRQEFPAVGRSTYLNTAGGAPMPQRVARAAQTYYDEAMTMGDANWKRWLGRHENARRLVGRMLNTSPDTISLVPTATHGMNFIAQLMVARGDHVLASDREFPSTTLPWINAGADISFIPLGEDGCVDLSKAESYLRPDTKVFVASHVQYQTGFRYNLSRLTQFCNENRLQLVVDAVQSFGALPIDVNEFRIDALVFSGYKWALAGYGIAGVYIHRDCIANGTAPLAGWRSSREPSEMVFDRLDFAKTGRMLEGGHPLFAGSFALAAGLDLIEEIGVANIAVRNEYLVQYLHDRLDEKEIAIGSPRSPHARSAITMIPMHAAAEAQSDLMERGIFVGSHENNLRISVNFYNDEADIDRLVDAIVSLRTRHFNT